MIYESKKGFLHRHFKHTFRLFYYVQWLCRHKVPTLAAFQTTDLIEGNHCLHNEFAWSYGPSILMMPVENAISFFASQFPITA